MADEYRLPTHVRPLHYDLTLAPDLDRATFAGEVRIVIDVEEPTSTLVLNSVGLDIKTARVVGDDGAGCPLEIAYDEDNERVTLTSPGDLEDGEYDVRMTYTGPISDELRGFYLSKYTDPDGVERSIACTQFESTDARRAFPCWDEPEFKATFAITLIVAEDLLVVSNSPIEDIDELGGGRKQVRFAPTMTMSTYLVAWVIGPLAATEPVDCGGVPVRVIAPEHQLPLGKFALQVAEAALAYFTDYFGLEYPGDKLDLVAIPDFAFGAMENLGCVTFRETALLVEESTASREELERVADVVNHEIAHMWFGDLVTMSWWHGIWLNEAFATFMEVKATDAFRPKWDRWTSFGLERSAAYGTDSLAATRPVEFKVTAPDEAEGMFDVLTYIKGGGVVRMLEQYLGETTFRDGIRAYLDTHAYGNADTPDLWAALAAVSGEPVADIMNSWIHQGGHPVVHVRPDGEHALRLEQQRFLVSAQLSEEQRGPMGDNPGQRWSIPVLLRASVNGNIVKRRLLLTKGGGRLALDGPVDWVVVNAGGSGFYRVTYDTDLLAGLARHTHDAQLTALERFALVNDSWGAVLAGDAPTEDFLQMCEFLTPEEDDPDVLSAMAAGLGGLYRIADDGPDRRAVAEFVRRTYVPLFRTLGWDDTYGDSDRKRSLRGRLVTLLGGIGEDAEMIATAQRMTTDYLADRRSVEADLVAPVLTVAAARADGELWERFRERFQAPATPQEQQTVLRALCEVTDGELFDRTLDMALGAEIRKQDTPLALARLVGNREWGQRAWDAVCNRWTEMVEYLPSSLMPRVVAATAAHYDRELADSVRTFMAEHPLLSMSTRLGPTRAA